MGQIVRFVELVHDCILSEQHWNEMNRRYCDAIWSGMKALTVPHLPCMITLPSELHVKTCQRHVLTRNARNAEYWHMLLQVVT